MFFHPHAYILNYFLDEYIDTRAAAYASASGVLSGAFGIMSSKINTIAEIQKVRIEISNKIIDIGKKATIEAAAEAWVELMLVLGQKARIVQNDTRNISHSCEMLHAMRSYIYLTLLSSELGAKALHAKVTELTMELEIKVKNINDIPTDLPNRSKKVNVIKEEYNRVLRNRAYLYVITLQGRAEIESHFPTLEYPPLVSDEALTTKSQYILNQNLPYVFHAEYCVIYINKYFNPDEKNLITLRSFEENQIKRCMEKDGCLFLLPEYLNARPLYERTNTFSSTASVSGLITEKDKNKDEDPANRSPKGSPKSSANALRLGANPSTTFNKPGAQAANDQVKPTDALPALTQKSPP